MSGLANMWRYLLVWALATGCAHFVKLDPKNVSALEVSGDAKAQICARGALVDVKAVTKDGKKFPEGDRGSPKENEFDPALVKLDASTGSFNDHSWNPPNDPLALLSVDEITITATLIANPQITATTKVSPMWACDAPVAYLGGNDGGQGDMGVNDGEDGKSGGQGDNGQNVAVTVGWIQHHEARLAIADVQSDAGESVYVLDPTTPLKVLAGGGAGGAGGTGAFGRGMDNCVGKGGRGGRGGDGGVGGDGGDVTVRYDAANPELAQLVVVDAHGGDAGPPGGGGGGGSGPNGCGDWGDSGAEGREGKAGRDGRVSTQPVQGINSQLASLSRGGPSPKVAIERPAPAEPPPAAPPPRGHGKHSKVAAAPEPPPAPAPKPAHVTPHETADGARYYSGRAELTASVPHRKPEKEHMMVRVESTRTRRRHFTIVFGECKLDFHRPNGEQQHRYALDAPSKCAANGGSVAIKDATLELDTAKDALALTWNGTADVKGIPGPMTVAFTFTGQRR